MNWVDELIRAMEASVGQVLTIKIDGQTVQTMIQQDAVDFFKKNKKILEKMGKQTFRDFLGLVQAGKRDEAFHVMLKAMSADDIIDQMEMTEEELKAWNDTRDQFMVALKDFALKTLAPQLLRVLVALLLA